MDQETVWGEDCLLSQGPAQVNLCCRMAPKKKKDSWSFKPWKSSYVAQNNKDSHVAMIFFHDCKRCIRAPKKEMTIQSTYVDLWNRQFITAPRWLWNGLNLVIWPWDHEIMSVPKFLPSFYIIFVSFSLKDGTKGAMLGRNTTAADTRLLQPGGLHRAPRWRLVWLR